MKRSLLGLIILCTGLSGCYTPMLVAENRDGEVIFQRLKYYERQYSDQSAEKYCLRYQKPSTWMATVMTKKGDFHDKYKCGSVPAAKLSTPTTDTGITPQNRDEASGKGQERQTLSGDYFSSGSKTGSRNQDW